MSASFTGQKLSGLTQGNVSATSIIVHEDSAGNVLHDTVANLLALGGGSGVIEITIASGAPSAAPASGSPLVYMDSSTGTLYGWNGTGWVAQGGSASNAPARNGLVLDGSGNYELGQNAIIKNTTIADPTGAFNITLERDAVKLALEGNDADGEVSANMTSAVSAGNYAILKVKPNATVAGKSTDGSDTTIFNMNPNAVNLIHINDDGVVTGVYQNGSNITMRSALGSESAGMQAFSPQLAEFLATDGTNKVAFLVEKDKMKLHSPKVDAGTAVLGQVLTIIDPATGESDFQTPSGGITTYDAGNGVTVTGTAGITASAAAGGVITITKPTDGVITNGSIDTAKTNAIYTAGGRTAAIRVVIDETADNTVTLKRFKGLVESYTGVVSASNRMEAAVNATVAQSSDVYQPGISDMVFDNIPANTNPGHDRLVISF